ncbi:MAG: hypothetical protein EOM02_00330 [Synergistales bacterium]|nr:hypothetical protein [Synergistales bacterium]
MYVDIRNDKIKLLPSLPFRIYREDGQSLTSISSLPPEELRSLGFYPAEEIKPNYNSDTQKLGDPDVVIDGDHAVVTYPVVDRSQEEIDAELYILREGKKREIALAWQNDIETVGMPVEGENFSVDYGVEDALIWRGAVKRVPEEAVTVEVRSIDNTFHVIPHTLFVQIPDLQEDYYAQQLQKKWLLQKAVDSAATKSEIEAIAW